MPVAPSSGRTAADRLWELSRAPAIPTAGCTSDVSPDPVIPLEADDLAATKPASPPSSVTRCAVWPSSFAASRAARTHRSRRSPVQGQRRSAPNLRRFRQKRSAIETLARSALGGRRECRWSPARRPSQGRRPEGVERAARALPCEYGSHYFSAGRARLEVVRILAQWTSSLSATPTDSSKHSRAHDVSSVQLPSAPTLVAGLRRQ